MTIKIGINGMGRIGRMILRSIFENHFPSNAAAMSVPSVPSVACSTPVALEWDKAFKNVNDPSGRAIANIHNKSY